MPDNRILLVENPASLSVDLGRLRIRREGHDDIHIAPDDIAVLCLHHHTIHISVQALRILAQAGTSVIVTDANHHPCATLLPTVGNGDLVRRLRQQMDLDGSPQKGALWQRLVQARLNTQAVTLRTLERNGALRLERLASQVQPHDADNREAQGARHYWENLMPKGFRRQKQGAADPINARLNFGFAVLRSLVARTLVNAGLHPALGLGHNSMENPFNLADDFIEPYRFVVERHVVRLAETTDFDGPARKRVLSFMDHDISMGKNGYRLPSAVTETVNSFVRLLDGGTSGLLLPVDSPTMV